MRRFALPGVMLLISACSGLSPSRSASSHSDRTPLTVLFSHHHHLEVEPCGCSMNALGGLERAAVYAKESRERGNSTQVYLIAGQSFTPFGKFNDTMKKHYLLKAKALAQSLEGIGATAISPSYLDFKIGKQELLAILKETKVPVISSNLTDSKSGELIFPSYHLFPIANKTAVVIAVSSAAEKIEGVNFTPPLRAIESTLSHLPKAPDFVVLLADIPRADRLEIVKRFPQIHLVLGSSEEGNSGVQQFSSSTLIAEAMDRGRSITRIDYQLQFPVTAAYNEKVARASEYTKAVWSNDLTNLKRKPSKKKTKDELFQEHNMQDFLERAKSFPTKLDDTTSSFEVSTDTLDAKYEPKTPLSIRPYLEDWKKGMRDLESIVD